MAYKIFDTKTKQVLATNLTLNQECLTKLPIAVGCLAGLDGAAGVL